MKRFTATFFFVLLTVPNICFAMTRIHASQPQPTGRYLPILMYHHIAARATQNPYFVSPETFDAQLAWLKTNGYTVISMDTAVAALKSGAPLPPNPVVITFDDGLRDQYTNALPILKKYHDTATFYVISGMVGDPEYMTWDMVRAMHAAGMQIGAHTKTHQNVKHLSGEKLIDEIAGSKIKIQEELHSAVTSFAYPGGAYNDAAIAEVHAAGFTNAVSTRHKVMHAQNENQYAIGRMHIDDDLVSFANFVTGKKMN